MTANALEAVAGILLVFFVPGYTITKATFPEWRIRGPAATLRLLEVLTLSFVTSLALTVLVGYFLLVGGPSGFQASWSDPLLESILAALAVIALGVGWMRGAYARDPPAGARPEPADEAGTWPAVESLDRLLREERRVRQRLRHEVRDSPDAVRLRAELDRIEREAGELRARREAEYAH